MEGTYGVFFEGENVGTITVIRSGLYYALTSQCRVPETKMLHLIMEIENCTHDLGLLIPVDGTMRIKKQIPIKRIGAGEPFFYLRERNASADLFVCVREDEAFPHLHRLKDSVFSVRNGEPGLILNPQKIMAKK